MEKEKSKINKNNPLDKPKNKGIFKSFISIFGFKDEDKNKTNQKETKQKQIENDKTMWIPDEKAQTCFNCRKEFSAIFLRKHHCRICGNVFCKDCSCKTVEGKYWGTKKEIKVCDYCYDMYKKLDETLIETTVENTNSNFDENYLINDNMKNLKRETKLSEYCKLAKKEKEDCVKFLQMDKKSEQKIKMNLDNYFDFLLNHVIESIFKAEGINEKWIDNIFEVTKKAIFETSPSFRDLKDNLNINDYLKIKTILSKEQSTCKIINGFAFQKNVCTKKMNTNIENPKILLLDCGLDYYRNNENITDFENLKLQEPAYIEIIKKKIELVEPNVILVNKNISRKIQEEFTISNKVSLVINVKSSSLKRIARCTRTYVLPSTDLIDKQTIMGTCKKFRVEKIKFPQGNNYVNPKKINENNVKKNLVKNFDSEKNENFSEENKEKRKSSNDLINPDNILNTKNKESFNFPRENYKNYSKNLKNTNKSSKNLSNFQNFFEQSKKTPLTNNFDLLKSNEYNLMIFEGCDDLLFGTIILYGQDIEELKKLKKTLREILLTARDLYLQQHLLYFFYADIKNLTEAYHSDQLVNNKIIETNSKSCKNTPEKKLKENLQIEDINNLSRKESSLSLNSDGPIGLKSFNQIFNLNFAEFDTNRNITNMICCLGKIDKEFNQFSKDFFFGFDKNLVYEDKSKLAVVRLIMTQGSLQIQNSTGKNLNILNNLQNINPDLIKLDQEKKNSKGNCTIQKPKKSLLFSNEQSEKDILEQINCICDEPEELDLIYYSKDDDYDKPLGKLILDLSGESESKCESCKRLKANHFYYIYRKTGRLKIQLGQNNQEDFCEKIMDFINVETNDFTKINSLSKGEKERNIYMNSKKDYNIDIFSYGVCKICKKVVTPLIKITKEIFNFSVAKYFKFMLFNHEIKNRSNTDTDFNLKKHFIAENNCSHFLNKDINRIFVSKLGTVKFTYENSPLYFIETSPIHEPKDKKKLYLILEEQIKTNKKRTLDFISDLSNNFIVLFEELNSDLYKNCMNMIIFNNVISKDNFNPNNFNNINQCNNNTSTNSNINPGNNNKENAGNSPNEKTELKDYFEKIYKISQNYMAYLNDISFFVENVYIASKFKNYLKSMAVMKKVYFRILQIKLVNDKCWKLIGKIRRFINMHLENKTIQKNVVSGNNNSNNNINNNNNNNSNNNSNNNCNTNKNDISTGEINKLSSGVLNKFSNGEINERVNLPSRDISPDQSSVIKENNNTSKDYISQLNQNLNSAFNSEKTLITLNLIPPSPIQNNETDKEKDKDKDKDKEIDKEKPKTVTFEESIENTNTQLHRQNSNGNNNIGNIQNDQRSNLRDKENQSIFGYSVTPTIHPQPSVTFQVDEEPINKTIKAINKIIDIDNKEYYKAILRSVNFFDELNHKTVSSEISANDIASIISYTLTSDKYREYISPANRFKPLDVKCKRFKKPDNSTQNIFTSTKNANNSSDNIDKEKSDVKYGYTFFSTPDMEVYDTSLLFDQNKNNYTYQNLDNNKINQQLETELLSDDKSHFNYTFTNMNFMSLLSNIKMDLEYQFTDDKITPLKKLSRASTKNFLSNLNSNNPEFQKKINQDEKINAPTNSGNNKEGMDSSENANAGNSTNQSSLLINEERALLNGNNVRSTLDELENIRKELKIYKNNNYPSSEICSKTRKKKIDNNDISTQMDIEVYVYYPRQFEALRITYCASYNDFILSLAKSAFWSNVTGGKSKADFFKSHDNKYILKSVSKHEFKMFIETGFQYFHHNAKFLFHKMPSALAKILGVYKIKIKQPKSTKVENIFIILMENLFFGKSEEKNKNTVHSYDLKGSKTSRYIFPKDQKPDQVLPDTNFKIDFGGEPIILERNMEELLKAAIHNDSLILSKMNVVDYSLLLIIDNNENLNDHLCDYEKNFSIKSIRLGIIDYIRKYTWDKQLEHVGKVIINRLQVPTIVNPINYKERFKEAVDKYFIGI